METIVKRSEDGGASDSRVGAASSLLVGLVVGLFFLWGGLTSLNDVLIPKLKGLFSLSYAEAMLTQFAFFLAYFVCSIPAGVLVSRLGYFRGIVCGLGVMAVGCLMFPIAAGVHDYAIFLAALFVLAAGITVLQVAANPLIANLGSRETSHSRLTLAQAFNSLGTTVFPPIGAMIILGSLDEGAAAGGASEAAVIGHAYEGIAVVLALIAALFWWRRNALGLGRSEDARIRVGFGLLRRPRLGFGVLSIFLYVGAEVTIGSLLINYLSGSDVMGVSEVEAGKLLAFYWGGAMVGRFVGAGALRLYSPGRVLMCVALGAAGLTVLSAATSGYVAGWALLSVGLMNAIMFPTIFSLSVEGLGKRTPQGSGLLCMAIFGGAVIPLLAGQLADEAGLAVSLIVPAFCYLTIAWFGRFAEQPVANASEE